MRKQLDPRIPTLVANNVKKNHRSFIVLVGDKGRDQVCAVKSENDLVVYQDVSDRKSPLLALPSSGICAALGAMVLQEGTGVHNVSGISSPPQLT
jgi:hypothetical protein